MIRKLVIASLFAGAIIAILILKTDHHDVALAAPTASGDLIDRFTTTCTGGADAPECAVLHAGVVAQTIQSIQELADTHDPAAQAQARAALAVDEPQLQLFAAKLLEYSPTKDDAVAAVPLLLGPHPALQRAAIKLMNSSTLTDIADRWNQGHATNGASDPYELMPAPPAVAAQFTAYPNAKRYPPGDSSQSIGWYTSDSLDKVVALYAKTGKPLDGPAWKAAAASPFERDAKEMSDLMQEFQKTHDMKLMTKVQEIQKRMTDSLKNGTGTKQPTQAPGGAAIGSRKMPLGNAAKTFTAFAVEGDAAKPIRAVAIYRVDELKATVVEMIWDTSKYPAW